MAIQISGAQIKDLAVSSGKLAGSIPSNKIDLTGSFNFSSGTLQAGNPSNASDVANKSYVDGLVGAGIFWKEPARVASTANVNLSSAPAAIDGVTLSMNDRVLIKDQSSGSQNGVYEYKGSGNAMTRSSDADAASELDSMAIFISQGATNADAAFVQTADVVNLGSDTVTYVQFTGLGQITAGTALSKTGNQLNVQVDSSSVEVNGSDQLQVKALGITDAMIAGNISASKLAGSIPDSKLDNITTANKVQGSSVQLNASGAISNDSGLKVGVDDSTVEINSNALRIKDLGVSAAKLAGSIPDSKLDNITTANKVQGSSVQLNAAGAISNDSGLKVGVDDSTIEIASNQLKFKLAPTFETLSPDGNDVNFDLGETLQANWEVIIVIKNGLVLKQVGSSPSDADEYLVNRTGGTGGVSRVEFGSAPAGTDDLRVMFFSAS